MNYLRCITLECRHDMPGLWRASQAGRSKSFRQTSGHILRLVSKTYWSSIWRKRNALWVPTRYRSLVNHFQTCLCMKKCDTVNRSILLTASIQYFKLLMIRLIVSQSQSQSHTRFHQHSCITAPIVLSTLLTFPNILHYYAVRLIVLVLTY